MKFVFILSLLLCIHQLSAQQNVGIGTSTPNANAILDLSSTTKGLLVPRMTSAQRTAIPNVPGMFVYDTDTKEFYHNDGTNWRKIINSTIWNSSSTRNWTYNTTDSIGIGTSNPDERLHILSGKIYVQDNRTNQSPHIIFDAPAVDFKEGGLQWKRSGDTMASINYIANPNFPNYLRFSVSNNGKGPDLFINQTGYLGLGFADPQVKLHIRSSTATEMIRLEGENPMIQLRRYASLLTYEDVAFIQTSGDNLRVGTNSNNTLGKFVVRTGGGDRLFVDANGNVSIGTSAVASGYKLSINGKAICEELKVQLSGNWPDYVFKKDYNLMPLPQLEQFINTNKHLPNIPKAIDVQKSGIEVGDMQKRMMEKIEELTLYIIDLQKQVEELKKKEKQ